MNIEQVREYIESEGLNGRSREQFYVFRRHYLCWALYRSQELTLGEVGSYSTETIQPYCTRYANTKS